MDKHFGWWVDLSKVVLNDPSGKNTTWVHALPFGEYQHPLHGKMVFDTAKLSGLATSVKQKVRGIDPDIDYDHKTDPAKGNQAAGWVKDADVRGDGLWIKVDFTDDGAQDVKDKKYRYFSAEFVDEWTDSLGTTHKDVLMGGGITNRPYMKNLLPVNLSELSFNQPAEGGQDEVDGKKLRAALGLAETTTDEEVFTKLAQVGTDLATATTSVTTLTEEKGKLEQEIAKLKEPDTTDADLRKLIEASPAFKKLYEATQEKDAQLIKLQEGIKLAEVEKQLVELQGGKQFALAPSARDGLRTLMLKMPPEGAKLLYEFLVSVTEGKALVDLSERGYTGRRENMSGDATVRFNEAVQGYMKEQKAAGTEVDYGSAVEHVARTQPALFNEYREDTYQFKA